MRNIGFIGYGHMGSVLVNSILESKTAEPENVFLFNRTSEKFKEILTKYTKLNVESSIKSLSSKAEVIVICTSTYSVIDVLKDIKFNKNTHLILINSGIRISTVEKIYKGKITRLIPTITSEVFTGYNILCCNRLVEKEDKIFLKKLLEPIGGAVELNEDQFAAGSDLTSCAPAIISEIHNIYIKLICQKSGIDFEIAEKMFNATLDGIIKLKDKNNETTQEIIDRVATKGGSTEAAINVLREKLPGTFEQLLKKTEFSHKVREDYTEKQFLQYIKENSKT